MTERIDAIEGGIQTTLARSHRTVRGLAFLAGLAGMFALVIAAGAAESVAIHARLWTRLLPLAVLAFFWPVCISDSELARRVHWPPLFRYSIETAVLLSVIAALYASVWGDAWRFVGILGGTVAALSCWLRGYLEQQDRGDAFDQSLGLLSSYVTRRRWRSSASRQLPPN